MSIDVHAYNVDSFTSAIGTIQKVMSGGSNAATFERGFRHAQHTLQAARMYANIVFSARGVTFSAEQ